MKYLVRINPRAVNPITKQIDASRVWEVEQTKTKDSEACKWHCADVQIDNVPISKIFKFSTAGEKSAEMEFFGVCVRGMDESIQILTQGRHEVS